MSPSECELEKLGERAGAVVGRLPGEIDPVVVEFAGSPKAGKTTTIDIVAHFFKRMGYKVWAPTEGASKRTPYHLRRDLVAYNTWTLNYAISEILVAYHNVERHHLIILDRGPFDSLAWMSLLRSRGLLDSGECEIIRAFALHPRWSGKITRVYLFTCKPEVSLDRESQSKLTRRHGSAMNPEMLGALLKEYEALKNELESPPLYPIDTSCGTTPLSSAHEIAVDVLSIFEERVNAKAM